MTSRDFCYWLQGFIEIQQASDGRIELSPPQLKCIQQHLALVFKHEIDPSFGPPDKQQALDKIHHGIAPKPPWQDPSNVKVRC